MIKKGNFILFTREEFKDWLKSQNVSRSIKLIQNHHTYIPNYSHFKGSNHFEMLEGMRNSHMNRGFNDIAQQLTSFPDGSIGYSLGRDFNRAPAGIKGANENGICIEHIGNFDINGDKMNKEHRQTILFLNAILCSKFDLQVNTNTVVYHHWWDLKTGERKNGAGQVKSCPGTNFFQGNKVEDANKNFIPHVSDYKNKLNKKEGSIESSKDKEKVAKIMKTFSKYFDDVQAEWMASSVDYCKENGIIGGKEDKKFDPNSPITRGEMAVVLKRTIDFILNQK